MANMTSSDNASLLLASEMSGSFGEAMVPVDVETVDTWVWLAYDQLNIAFLDALDLDGKVGVVLIESSHKAQRRPYHQQKLGVLLSNQRHFALELQAAGYPVMYVISRLNYAHTLSELRSSLGTINGVRAAERELRLEIAPLEEDGSLMIHELLVKI